jgi:mannose-6-phosphate isomerase-like protein (cupin superfamily)
MKAINIEKAEIVKNPHGVKSQKLHSTENVSVMYLTLELGEKLRQHITPVDVFFFVIEGKGIVEIGDEKKEVFKNTLIDSPKGIMHCWYNESEETLKIMAVKTPFPSEPTIFLN